MADLKVFVGYDAREDIAWQVCRHSIARHSETASAYPLRQTVLRELGLYARPADVSATTDFSLTRFLTPYLAATEGWSVFVDCDFLFTTDVARVLEGLDPTKAVYVVQHEYTPRFNVKMDGKQQSTYPRKNWSSFMVFNGAHPDVKALTPDRVNQAAPADLHRLNWVRREDHIGALPLGWNFLVGEYDRPATVPEAIHYTNGGPWFADWQDVDYGDLWARERKLVGNAG